MMRRGLVPRPAGADGGMMWAIVKRSVATARAAGFVFLFAVKN